MIKDAEKLTAIIKQADTLSAEIENERARHYKPDQLKLWQNLLNYSNYNDGYAPTFIPPDKKFLIAEIKQHFSQSLISKMISFTGLFGKDPTEYFLAYRLYFEKKKKLLLQYDFHIRKHAYDFGKKALERRVYVVEKVLKKKYGGMSTKRLDRLIEAIRFYATLSSDLKIPHSYELFYNIKSHPDLNSIDDNDLWLKKEHWRKPGAPYFTAQWTRPEDKKYGEDSKVAKQALVKYMGQKNPRAAINALYIQEPILIALRNYYKVREMVQPILMDTEKFRRKTIESRVQRMINDMADSNKTLSDTLRENEFRTKWEHLSPLLRQAVISLKHTTNLDHDYLDQALRARLGIKPEDDIADTLSAISYLFVAVAFFCAATPFAVAAGLASAFANLSQRSYMFYRASEQEGIRKAINKYPDGGEIIDLAEKADGSGDEFALLFIEVLFSVPALKAVHGVRVQGKQAQKAAHLDKLKGEQINAKSELEHSKRALGRAEAQTQKIKERGAEGTELTSIALKRESTETSLSAQKKYLEQDNKRKARVREQKLDKHSELLRGKGILDIEKQITTQQNIIDTTEKMLEFKRKIYKHLKGQPDTASSKLKQLEKDISNLELKLAKRRAEKVALEKTVRNRAQLPDILKRLDEEYARAAKQVKKTEQKISQLNKELDNIYKERERVFEEAVKTSKEKQDALMVKIEKNEARAAKIIQDIKYYQTHILPDVTKNKHMAGEALKEKLQEAAIKLGLDHPVVKKGLASAKVLGMREIKLQTGTAVAKRIKEDKAEQAKREELKKKVHPQKGDIDESYPWPPLNVEMPTQEEIDDLQRSLSGDARSTGTN